MSLKNEIVEELSQIEKQAKALIDRHAARHEKGHSGGLTWERSIKTDWISPSPAHWDCSECQNSILVAEDLVAGLIRTLGASLPGEGSPRNRVFDELLEYSRRTGNVERDEKTNYEAVLNVVDVVHQYLSTQVYSQGIRPMREAVQTKTVRTLHLSGLGPLPELGWPKPFFSPDGPPVYAHSQEDVDKFTAEGWSAVYIHRGSTSVPPRNLVANRVGQPSEDDWFWYHTLTLAGLLTDNRLNGSEDKRLTAAQILIKKRIEPPSTDWAGDAGGWRSCLENTVWRTNAKQFFNGKIRRCAQWLEENPSLEPPNGKRGD